MAVHKEAKFRSTQLYSNEFVNCAGCVLFYRWRGQGVHVCLLKHLQKEDEWILPKGRQDRGESLSEAALRETFEETGFKCTLLPITMKTRAPQPGISMKDIPYLATNCTEPFTVTLRHVSERDIKFVWWYIAIVPEDEAERKLGTQMRREHFESVLWDVDVDVLDEAGLEDVVSRLTYSADREIVKSAIKLVHTTYPSWFTRTGKS